MKESIGATWIMGIVIFFIVLFTGYLAFSINYSKAFRVKDGIVERIEKYNGPNKDSLDDITSFMEEISYNSSGRCDNLYTSGEEFVGVFNGNVERTNLDENFNYCIGRVKSSATTYVMDSAYYKVVVFFNLSIPVIRDVINFHATGETTNILFPKECGFFKTGNC